jgi:hypothetical protein
MIIFVIFIMIFRIIEIICLLPWKICWNFIKLIILIIKLRLGKNNICRLCSRKLLSFFMEKYVPLKNLRRKWLNWSSGKLKDSIKWKIIVKRIKDSKNMEDSNLWIVDTYSVYSLIKTLHRHLSKQCRISYKNLKNRTN